MFTFLSNTTNNNWILDPELFHFLYGSRTDEEREAFHMAIIVTLLLAHPLFSVLVHKKNLESSLSSSSSSSTTVLIFPTIQTMHY